MKDEFRYEKIDRNEITEEQFKQVLNIERSEGEDDCYSEEVMKELFIEDPKIDNFVCYDKDEIVAYLSINPKSKRRNGSAYIISLVVAPNHRRKGIASELIRSSARYYKEKGEPMLMSLQVDKDNYSAINLYKKVGFDIREPICEVDYGEEQYIMDAKIIEIENNNYKKL